MGSVDGIMPISQDSSHNLDNGFDANYGDPSTHNETIESDALSRYSLTSTPLEDQAVFLRRSERKPKPTSKLNACSLPCIKDAPCKNNSSKKRKYEKQFLNGVKAVSLQDACCYESVRSSTATLQANIIGASEKDQNDGKGTVNEESNSHCLKEKTERDTRKRKSVQCTEEAASQRLYAITQDGCEYTYYILSRQSEPNKKDTNVTEYWETVSYRERLASYADNKSKTDTKSRTATRKSRNYTKREGVNDLKRSKAKRIKKVSDASMKADKYTYKLIRLEDHLDSYCIEDFTGSAPSVSRNPNEHEQSSRYLCKLCGSYRTLKREQLEQHIGYHMSGKLNCSQCNFIADSSHNLKSHKRAEHHADKALYLCEICGVGKSNSTTFKTHVSKVHGKAVYKCCKCNSQFHDDKEFREHRLNAHEASSAFKCDV